MIKHIFTGIFATSALIFAISANAAQLNLKLGNDIITHKDLIKVDAEIYYASGPGPLDIGGQTFKLGIPVDKIYDFTRVFNNVIADKRLVSNFDGKQSQITLGYQKDGSEVYPVSCQNMKLTAATNIVMSERGCSVY